MIGQCYRRALAAGISVMFPTLYKVMQQGYHVSVAGPVVRHCPHTLPTYTLSLSRQPTAAINTT